MYNLSAGERIKKLTANIPQQADALEESLDAVESQMLASLSSTSSSSMSQPQAAAPQIPKSTAATGHVLDELSRILDKS